MTEFLKQMDTEVLLREVDTARILGVKCGTLSAWRYRGKGPRYVSLSSRAVRYRLKDLNQFISKHLKNSTSEILSEQDEPK